MPGGFALAHIPKGMEDAPDDRASALGSQGWESESRLVFYIKFAVENDWNMAGGEKKSSPPSFDIHAPLTDDARTSSAPSSPRPTARRRKVRMRDPLRRPRTEHRLRPPTASAADPRRDRGTGTARTGPRKLKPLCLKPWEHGPLNRGDLKSTTKGIRNDRFAPALNRLVNSGRVTSGKLKGRRGDFYRLSSRPAPDGFEDDGAAHD